MTVLGIESSCDETAASVVVDGKRLLSNAVASSMNLHAVYGGVVPEIAARSHIESVMPVIREALDTAFPALSGNQQAQWAQIDAIAVTYGAGLGSSLLIGVLTARTLAIVYDKPLYAVNHVEAHLYANFLTETSLPGYDMPPEPPAFPILGLIVSGKHSQLVLFTDHFDYQLLGQTTDDAVGEAYDKVARILGLPYPGGPSIGRTAKEGNPLAFQLPKARLAGIYDFSFSGLKTAVLRLAQEQIGEDFNFPSFDIPERLSERQKADIAASFERVAVETLVDKTVMAYQEYGPATIIIGGGVASDPELRRQLSQQLADAPLRDITYADRKLCTDNGAMVATLGCYKAMRGAETADPYSLDISPSLSM